MCIVSKPQNFLMLYLVVHIALVENTGLKSLLRLDWKYLTCYNLPLSQRKYLCMHGSILISKKSRGNTRIKVKRRRCRGMLRDVRSSSFYCFVFSDQALECKQG